MAFARRAAAGAASVGAVWAATAASCEDSRPGIKERLHARGYSTLAAHDEHSDHFHVDVRGRLPVRNHFIHGLSWGEKGLRQYEVFVGESSLVSELEWGESACGHPGIVHGGALAASFDDAFGSLFFSQHIGNGFTARLEVDYKRPVPAGTPLRLVTRVDSIQGRKVWMSSTLQGRPAAGEEAPVFAVAKSLFLVARVPKPEEMGERK